MTNTSPPIVSQSTTDFYTSTEIPVGGMEYIDPQVQMASLMFDVAKAVENYLSRPKKSGQCNANHRAKIPEGTTMKSS